MAAPKSRSPGRGESSAVRISVTAEDTMVPVSDCRCSPRPAIIPPVTCCRDSSSAMGHRNRTSAVRAGWLYRCRLITSAPSHSAAAAVIPMPAAASSSWPMTRRRRMGCRSSRETVGVATVHTAPVTMPGSIISGMAMPFSSPNWAAATEPDSPERRRHMGSSTAFRVRMPVRHSRDTAMGALSRNSSFISAGLGRARLRGRRTARRSISSARQAAASSAASGRAADSATLCPPSRHSSAADSRKRTVCSVHSFSAGVRVSCRPQQ